MHTDQCTLISVQPLLLRAFLGQSRPQLAQSFPEPSSYRMTFFSTFVGQLHLKPLLLRAFLEGNPSEMLSKVGVIDGAVMKKSKKHCTGAPPESPSIVKQKQQV